MKNEILFPPPTTKKIPIWKNGKMKNSGTLYACTDSQQQYTYYSCDETNKKYTPPASCLYYQVRIYVRAVLLYSNTAVGTWQQSGHVPVAL